jgi:ubiquinone/menaquinone biosynthesis C-methylase UbiE
VVKLLETLTQLRSQGIEGYFAVKYADFAKETPSMRQSYAELASRVAAVVGGGAFLEVGPGPAFISIEIARGLPQANIIGLEISETMVRIGSQNVAEAGVSHQVALRQGDAARMPFGAGAFDFVVSSGSLHHWSKPAAVFDEIHRVLKPGQPALVYDLRRDAPKEKVGEASRGVKSRFMRWGLRHSIAEAYTPETVQGLLSRTRFVKAERIDLDDLGMFIWLRKAGDATTT